MKTEEAALASSHPHAFSGRVTPASQPMLNTLTSNVWGCCYKQSQTQEDMVGKHRCTTQPLCTSKALAAELPITIGVQTAEPGLETHGI